ncbi:phage tail tape measure C-terminal domain-containing protein [Paraburkholderia sp. J67]|uniref:phage tail tape measure C-terminal domain-containing protein n=1 Tax=Paraburkholderia sp. J67 TaxID=2805435 RepID=UPI002ABD5232|nr:phage tail tape measure C-terminal domain-containing protein [Paraburkholderia sp. J67]
MDGLAREWQDTFKEMQQAEATWANQVIDALLQFVQTGKLNIAKLAESMALDVLKIKIQETFSTPLKTGLDALTNGINKLVFPNASSAAGNAAQIDPLAGVTASSIASTMSTQAGPLAALQTSMMALTTQGVIPLNAGLTTLGLQVTSATQAGAAVSNTTINLAAATARAAAALASIGGGSGLITGASMPTSATIQGSGPLFGATAGTGVAAFAGGGIMTSKGVAQLRKYATGGIADTPQLALYGEGSMPEAFVPLPDGRTIPVTVTASDGNPSHAEQAVPVVKINVINPNPQQGHTSSGTGGPRLDAQRMVQDAVLAGLQTPGSFRDAVRQAVR